MVKKKKEIRKIDDYEMTWPPLFLLQNYTAKLSDFGLAKDGPEGDETHITTRVMGTQGYAAPEYIMTGAHLYFQAIQF